MDRDIEPVHILPAVDKKTYPDKFDPASTHRKWMRTFVTNVKENWQSSVAWTANIHYVIPVLSSTKVRVL